MSTDFKASYALLIAVDENKVSNWALPVATKDIAALHAVLIHPERCAYPAEHVRVVSGQAATRQGILDGLQWLEQQLAADKSGNATAIVYYTGHGWREGTASPPDYYFIPYDIQESRRRGTALRAADFAEAIAALKPRRLLVVLDCCHAGGMGVKDVDAGAAPFTPAAPSPTLFTEGWGAAKALGEKGLEQLQSGQGRAVLVSSSGVQKSYVRADETMSVFTYHLIEALTGHAQPAGGAGEVLVSDVLSYVYRTVPKSAAALGQEQQPDGRLDGNFPVALLLGGKGLAKGEPAPDPLTPLPGGSTPGMVIHNESVQAETVNQAKTIYQRSAHAEGGGDATVNIFNVQAAVSSLSVILSEYVGQHSVKVDQTLLRRQIGSYLEWVVARYGKVTLRGIQRSDRELVELDLDEVYVPLSAKLRGSAVSETQLNEVLSFGNRIVLTGGPGSGKTTVLLYIAKILSESLRLQDFEMAAQRVGLRDNLDELIDKLHTIQTSGNYLRSVFSGLQVISDTSFSDSYDSERSADEPQPPASEIKLGLGELSKNILDFITMFEKRGQYVSLDRTEVLYQLRNASESVKVMSDTTNLPSEEYTERLAQIDTICLRVSADLRSEPRIIPVPIFVPLNAYAEYLRATDGSSSSTSTLSHFLSEYLIRKDSIIDLPKDFFRKLMVSGVAVCLLLDGLDEVSNERERSCVREAVEELVASRSQMRVVVTCRSAAYSGTTSLAQGFNEIRVNELSPNHVAQLVRATYGALYVRETEIGTAKSEELLLGIARIEERRRQLAGNDIPRLINSPLMVRMIIIVHYSERQLPDQRAELYLKTTNSLLLPDYSPDTKVAYNVANSVGDDRELHREIVQFVAYSLHIRGHINGKSISESDLVTLLTSRGEYSPYVREFLEVVQTRASVMEEIDGEYRFIHLSFQEFFVARYLATETRDYGRIVAFLEKQALLDSWWREPILLLIGYLALENLNAARRLLRMLAGIDPTRDGSLDVEPAYERQMGGCELAISGYLEWPSLGVQVRHDLSKALLSQFQVPAAVCTVNYDLKSRAEDALWRIGHPLFDPDMYCMPRDEMLGFVLISSPNVSCYISKYPVTVAQIQQFVTRTGYSLTERKSLDDPPGHPIRNVSIEDIRRYCLWLRQELAQHPLTPESLRLLLKERSNSRVVWQLTLPNEGEWLGASKGPTDSSEYPWGNEFDPLKCNSWLLNLKTTTPVYSFSHGASKYGCFDLCGNVWEATRSFRGNFVGDVREWVDVAEGSELVDYLVVKGGCYVDRTPRMLACQARDAWYAHSVSPFVGFRLALSKVVYK